MYDAEEASESAEAVDWEGDSSGSRSRKSRKGWVEWE